MSRTDGLYSTMTVLTTVSLRDIAPVTELARVLVAVEMVVDLPAVGIIATVVLGAVRWRRRGTSTHPTQPGGTDP